MISSCFCAKWVATKHVHSFVEIQYKGEINNNLYMLPKSLHKDSISILHSMIENALNHQHQWRFKVKQNQAEYGSSKEKAKWY